MADTGWPNKRISYEYPTWSTENNSRWQAAITSSLESGKLTLGPLRARAAVLTGACPRCGHHTEQTLTFGPIVPGLGPPTFNIVCTCAEGHRSDAGKPGCGWALELSVVINRPAEDARADAAD